MASIVIIGAGQAGRPAAHTLRKEGFEGKLVLVADEQHPPHERPPLSKAVFAATRRPRARNSSSPMASMAAASAPTPTSSLQGDVAVTMNPWAGRRMRLESWQNAQDQGIAAARSALGMEVDYKPLPWFWSDQYDMNLQIYGVPVPSHRVVLRGQPQSGSFVLFYLDGDRVKAALGPNAARDLRFARRLIESGKSVTPEHLADTSVPMSKL